MERNNSGKIKELAENGRLCEIYFGGKCTGDFELGKIIACGEECVLILSVNRYAVSDGIRMIYADDICRISENSKYIKKYEFLTEKYGMDTGCTEYRKYFGENGCGMTDLFEFARSKDKAVSLSLCGSDEYDITGFVVSYDDTTVTVREIGEYGDDEGTSFLNINDIDYCSCDAWAERSKADLFRQNNDYTVDL